MSGPSSRLYTQTLVLPEKDPRFDEYAKCGLATAHLFDELAASEGKLSYRRRVREAKAVCDGGCPVRTGCLGYGLANRLSGVLGGEELINGKIVAGARSKEPRR